jgi:hypothetical protein
MSLVRVYNISISLDGFGTGEGQSRDEPGVGAEIMGAGKFGHPGRWPVTPQRGGTCAWAAARPCSVSSWPPASSTTCISSWSRSWLGRGVRLWEGLEGLEKNYRVEATASPSGVTHVTFTR